MRILSITAGAAGMYCGSCFRDNGLARELIARGHEVTLVPVYTPTRTDEENVSRSGCALRWHQRLPAAALVALPPDSTFSRPAVGFPSRHRCVCRPRVSGRCAAPRRIDDLDAAGRTGRLKKEFDKLLEWTRGEPLPDVINLPNSLLIALAAPLKRALRRPVFVTLQGEELFVDGLLPSYRERALALIREQVPHVDGFIAVSEYCAEFMTTFLNIPPARMAVVPLGIDMTGYVQHQAGGGPFRVGYFARDRSGEGPARAGRCVHPLPQADGRGQRAARSGRLHGARVMRRT